MNISPDLNLLFGDETLQPYDAVPVPADSNFLFDDLSFGFSVDNDISTNIFGNSGQSVEPDLTRPGCDDSLKSAYMNQSVGENQVEVPLLLSLFGNLEGALPYSLSSGNIQDDAIFARSDLDPVLQWDTSIVPSDSVQEEPSLSSEKSYISLDSTSSEQSIENLFRLENAHNNSNHSCCCAVLRKAMSTRNLGSKAQEITTSVEPSVLECDLREPDIESVNESPKGGTTSEQTSEKLLWLEAESTSACPSEILEEPPVKVKRTRRRKPAPPPEVAAAKRLAYLQRNRDAAAKCRTRKKSQITDLEDKERELERMNQKLKDELKDMLKETKCLREQVKTLIHSGETAVG